LLKLYNWAKVLIPLPCSQALRTNATLTTLRLKLTKIGCAFLSYIAFVKWIWTLLYVRAGEATVTALANVLTTNQSLTSLDVSSNPIGKLATKK
jgi:hypothetical protein